MASKYGTTQGADFTTQLWFLLAKKESFKDSDPGSLDQGLSKWTGTQQRFGWKHKGDADELPPCQRPESLGPDAPVFEDVNYEFNDNRLTPPNYPAPECWKTSSTLPARYRGGNFGWLPGHTEVLWSRTKMNPASERTRAWNPPSTKNT